MAQVKITIGGRTYPLACRDGEESHLTSLAAHLQDKADELGQTLGTLSEAWLLLMAGILVADELFEQRRSTGAPDLTKFTALAERVEAIADALETDAGT